MKKRIGKYRSFLLFDYTQFLFVYRRIQYDLKSPVNAAQSTIGHTRSPELHHKQLRQDSISSDLSNLTVDSDGMILMK